MSGLKIQDVAQRAGVEAAEVRRLVDLGVIKPSTEGLRESDVRRVRLAEALVSAGLPLEGLAEGISRGVVTFDFVEQESYARFAALTGETYEELAGRTGIPIELLLAVRESMGFAQPSPSDRVRQDELEVVPLIQFELENGIRPAVIERTLRATGDSLRRVAETEAAWYRSEIIQPLLDKGFKAEQIARHVARFDKLGELSDQALVALFHGQQANAWLKNIFEGFEHSMAAIGLRPQVDHPPVVCFLDLTGYTRLTAERGDEAAANLATVLNRIVQRSSVEHGGRAVKWLGDGVMFLFHEPARAVLGALDMAARAREAGLPPTHVGLHCGPVLFQEGDYFGRTVNLASRIADYARPGEVLVSQDVVDALNGTPSRVTFTEIGPVELKGVSEPIRLHSAALVPDRATAEGRP